MKVLSSSFFLSAMIIRYFPAALLFAEELESRLDLRVDADCIFSSSHKAPQNPHSEKI